MAARPTVTVQSATADGATGSTVPMPAVLLAPIRPDVVHDVHKDMAKNNRQAYSVSWMAGMQTPGHSWGTGRAVARIPRVPGGGTSRSGQGAFGNMCRGGRMFAPNRVWRKWHFKVNKNQRRYALASALAASALPSLVMARGHQIEEVAEVPLVVSDDIQGIQRTADAVKLLKQLDVYDDVEKVKNSKKLRRGLGKLRDRRYTMRKGPLVIYAADEGCVKAFRNIPGVELADVSRLNLLDLAPGGHMGRLCIWSESAFAALDGLYGTYSAPSTSKKQGKNPYQLPRAAMTNSDLVRIINSDEIQSVLNAPKTSATLGVRKRNPLKRFDEMVKLNPYASVVKRAEIMAIEKGGKKRKTVSAASKDKRAKRVKAATEVTKDGEVVSAGTFDAKREFYRSMVNEPEELEEEEVAEEEEEEEEEAAADAAPKESLDDY
jgi:large subunit ribosomal protein L4e